MLPHSMKSDIRLVPSGHMTDVDASWICDEPQAAKFPKFYGPWMTSRRRAISSIRVCRCSHSDVIL